MRFHSGGGGVRFSGGRGRIVLLQRRVRVRARGEGGGDACGGTAAGHEQRASADHLCAPGGCAVRENLLMPRRESPLPRPSVGNMDSPQIPVSCLSSRELNVGLEAWL